MLVSSAKDSETVWITLSNVPGMIRRSSFLQENQKSFEGQASSRPIPIDPLNPLDIDRSKAQLSVHVKVMALVALLSMLRNVTTGDFLLHLRTPSLYGNLRIDVARVKIRKWNERGP